jgi:pilus assembly protein FimV
MPLNMHSNKRQKFSPFNLKTLSAAVVSALLFSNAYAAGLGKLTVMSALGQPLRAEIELTSVSKDEVGALAAKLASAEAFRQANIDFNPALLSLRFSVDQRAGKQFIRITSTQPVNEPFVDLLLELAGPNGRLIREYTFLLDPADMRAPQTAQIAPVPVPQASPGGGSRAPAPSEPARQQASPAESARPAPRAAARPALPAAAPVEESQSDAKQDEYRVKSGDTLAKIANRARSGGISLDQMLVALYRANPNAFVDKNMNRLRAGQILSVPGQESARGISNTEARGIVVAQSADFQNYRKKLATQVAGSASEKSADSRQTSTGKITAKVEEPSTPASESQDKLKLSKVDRAANGGAGAANAEDKIAREKAVAEANARVKELEKNVNDLQKLMEVKNQNLADQQKQAEANKAVPPLAAAPAVPVAPTAASSTPAQATPAASASVPASTDAAEKPAEAKPEQQTATAPTPSEPAAAAPAAPAVQGPKAAAPTPVPEPSFVDALLENPMVLPGAGILLAALGALGIVSARRRKQQKNFDDSIITDSSLKANSLFGSTGGQSVDTNNSVFNSNFSANASQLDSNEVDPVAEADVYIAYGRDAQAEEILKEALRTQPDRHAVRVKLLEIYSNRKDLRAFEVLATELYGLTKGQGDEWKQAATLGAALDPNNPLYAAGKPAKEADAEPGVLAVPTQSPDDHGLATLLGNTQANNGLRPIDDIAVADLGAETEFFSNKPADDQAKFNPAEPVSEPVADVVPEEPVAKNEKNDLDFNLDGFSIETPNTIVPPAPSEPNVDLASIDFDFLQEPSVAPSIGPSVAPSLMPDEKASEPTADAVPEFKLDDIAAPSIAQEPADSIVHNQKDSSLDFDFPSVPELPADSAEQIAAETVQPQPPADFDLSEISLELNPAEGESKSDLALDTSDAFDMEGMDGSPSDAEMATKLDLAIAYQEIGDKEGARELLDEVLKGGNAEQSEKARNLLLELA